MKRTIFLIGGSGFIGKNLARCYYNKYKICIFDKFIDTEYFSAYPEIETYQFDLVEQQIANELATPDYIINLASIVTAERDLSLFDSLISSNLKVLMNIFFRFKDDKKLKLFIQFGSSEEYGSKVSPFAEDIREQPNSPYALVKQLTTNTSIMLYQNYEFPIMIVRPGNLFGPLQDTSKFIPYVIETLIKNETLNVSLCEQKRDFLYVDDFAEIIEKIITKRKYFIGEIVNVSSGESISLKEIIEYCKLQLNSSSIINFGAIPYRSNEIMDLKCNINKLEILINSKIQMSVFDRLKKLLNLHVVERNVII